MSVDQNVELVIVRAPRGLRRIRGMAMRVGAFAIVELQKLRHDHTELFTRMVQPALWLLIFGQTFFPSEHCCLKWRRGSHRSIGRTSWTRCMPWHLMRRHP